MSNFGGIGFDARRAHLALIEGGAQGADTARDSLATLSTPPVLRSVPLAGRSTGFVRASAVEGARSSHEHGIRAVARDHDDFASALLPMVRASGVSEQTAEQVAQAILGNPALKAQAERAFLRARIDVV